MPDLFPLLSLAAIHWVAMLTPGPNVLLVTQVAAQRSRREALLVALGITAGAAVISSLAVLGLSVVLSQAAWLFRLLKVLGGSYLLYLGWRNLRAAWLPQAATAELNLPPLRTGRVFALGLTTNLSNPASLIFFSSVLTSILSPTAPAWLRVAGVGVIVLDALVWHLLLATTFSLPGVQDAYRRLRRPLDVLAGTLMAAFGLKVLWSAR